MTFGIGRITYNELYSSTARTIVSGPNAAATTFNLAHLPSDGVVAKAYGAAAETGEKTQLDANATYVLTARGTEVNYASVTGTDVPKVIADAATSLNGGSFSGNTALSDVIVVGSSNIDVSGGATSEQSTFSKVNTGDNKFVSGETYVIYDLASTAGSVAANTDGAYIKAASSDLSSVTTLAVGQKFTVTSTDATVLARLNALTSGMTFTKAADTLTKDIEAVQAKVNTARVQAGSQYAAMESAVDYTTDLTAQYELGFNTVNDVNFSMETAHLAKNQILQQAATAMLAQANQGQQSLLQLIQG
jgi:flagellin